ncbi:MAG: hypothetical protein ACRYFZ_07590 [Janthinobacterium lividum]
MNIFRALAGSLPLAALLLTAQAQSLPKVTSQPVNTTNKAATERQTADQRAAAYKGPKVVNSTKTLGNKMLRDSKPAPTPVAPAKQ